MAEAKANSGPTALAPRQSAVLKQFRGDAGRERDTKPGSRREEKGRESVW